MERRQLEYFLVIADAGSFTRAAARLNIAQPSLSASVRALEQELGVQLFERHGRGVRLTDAGEALRGPARRTIRSFSLAAGAVRASVEPGFGTLRLVTSTLWALEPLVGIVGELRRLHPGVRLAITDPVGPGDVLDRLRAGEADFGIVDGRPPAGPFASRWLVDHELVAVSPPGPATVGVSVSVSELLPLGLIGTPPGTAMRRVLDEQLEAAGAPLELAVETAHVASVVPLVLAGAGAAIVPEGLAAEAAAKGARVSRLDPPSRASVHLVWREDRLTRLGQQLLLVAGDPGATDGI